MVIITIVTLYKKAKGYKDLRGYISRQESKIIALCWR